MDNYETIRPNTFTDQGISITPKPISNVVDQKKQSSNVNHIIMCITILCIFLLIAAGIYFVCFKKCDDVVEPTPPQTQQTQTHPVSQPLRDDRVHTLSEKRKMPSLLPATSAISRAHTINTALPTIPEEPSEAEMRNDFEKDAQHRQAIAAALHKENDTEFAMTVADNSDTEEQSVDSDTVVIDINPTKCDFVLTVGKRTGQPCGVKCVNGSRCARHTGK